MTTHALKVLPFYFDAVADGTKPFEVRKDDRGFEVGHVLQLQEYSFEEIVEMPDGVKVRAFGIPCGHYTGRVTEKRITYILRHGDFPEGVPKDYVVLGLAPVAP